MNATERTRYDSVAMALHWVIAVLMIYMVFFGEDLMRNGERLANSDPAAAIFQPSIHVTIGVSILVLTLIRVVWRLTHRPPDYPPTMKRYEVVGSKALHGIFYLLLIGLPLTGWIALGGLVNQHPVMAGIDVFGAFPMPQPPFTSRIFREMHALGSNLAMALIGLHVLAALKHQFLDGDGVFRRMLPL